MFALLGSFCLMARGRSPRPCISSVADAIIKTPGPETVFLRLHPNTMLEFGLLDASVFCCLLLVHLFYRSRARRRLPYPPGPKPLPLIGNALDIPTVKGFQVFAEWAKQYSELLIFGFVNLVDRFQRLGYFIPRCSWQAHCGSQLCRSRQRSMWRALINIF